MKGDLIVSNKKSLFAGLTLIATLSLTSVIDNSTNQLSQVDNHVISNYNVENKEINNLDINMIKK